MYKISFCRKNSIFKIIQFSPSSLILRCQYNFPRNHSKCWEKEPLIGSKFISKFIYNGEIWKTDLDMQICLISPWRRLHYFLPTSLTLFFPPYAPCWVQAWLSVSAEDATTISRPIRHFFNGCSWFQILQCSTSIHYSYFAFLLHCLFPVAFLCV